MGFLQITPITKLSHFFFSAAISLEKEIFVFNIDGKVPLTITQMNLFQRKKL